MSTRCQIAFYENGQRSERIALIYKHYDGTPEEMVEKLNTIKNWFEKIRGYHDPSYLAARTLQKLMNEDDEREKEGPEIMKVTGYGIDNELHGDIAYLFNVYKDKITTTKK